MAAGGGDLERAFGGLLALDVGELGIVRPARLSYHPCLWCFQVPGPVAFAPVGDLPRQPSRRCKARPLNRSPTAPEPASPCSWSARLRLAQGLVRLNALAARL